MKYYEITFITKKGGSRMWVIHIEASQKASALLKAKTMWESDPKLKPMHRFDISGRVLKATEEFQFHYFTVVAEYK